MDTNKLSTPVSAHVGALVDYFDRWFPSVKEGDAEAAAGDSIECTLPRQKHKYHRDVTAATYGKLGRWYKEGDAEAAAEESIEFALPGQKHKCRSTPSTFNKKEGYSCDSVLEYRKKRKGYGSCHYSVHWKDTGKPVTISEWAELMTDETSQGFMVRKSLSEVILEIGFEAAFFETVGTAFHSASEQTFEFVVLESRELARFGRGGANPRDFMEHFCNDGKATKSFYNLGGDACLVIPQPLVGDHVTTYPHLMAFLNYAPLDQIDMLWKAVAGKYMKCMKAMSPHPIWLSTSGLGVAWLHFRLDTRPKYYQYNPFRRYRYGLAKSSETRYQRDGPTIHCSVNRQSLKSTSMHQQMPGKDAIAYYPRKKDHRTYCCSQDACNAWCKRHIRNVASNHRPYSTGGGVTETRHSASAMDPPAALDAVDSWEIGRNYTLLRNTYYYKYEY